MTKFPSWINEAINLRTNGMSYTNISKTLNVNKRTVSYYLKIKGFMPDERYVRLIQKQPNKKYVDENVFEVIDSQEKAYWLGMMYADGYVGGSQDSIEISLKEEDFNHIEKFKKFLKSDHKIQKKVKIINNTEYISYRLRVIRKKLKNDLINKGCTSGKTFNIDFPSTDIVSGRLMKHFIRGYVDGDGCICKARTSIVRTEVIGTKKFVNGLSNFLGFNGKYVYRYKNKESCSKDSYENLARFVLEGANAIKFLDYIYKDSVVHLDRKFEKYIKFASLYREYTKSKGAKSVKPKS